MTQHLPGRYRIDPADPRAPSMEEWERMTPAQRADVVAMLPGEEKLEDRLAASKEKLASFEDRLASSEEKLASFEEKLASLEEKLASLEEKLALALAEIEQLKRGR